MKFYSKKGLITGFFLWGTAIFLIGLFLFVPGGPSGAGEMAAALLITVSYCGFVSWCWFGTYYEINGSQLKVVGGPFRWKIDIMGIKGVRKSRNLLSSPALSLDRLEVTYEKWGMILISPKKQEKFCETLKKINPNIEVNLNK